MGSVAIALLLAALGQAFLLQRGSSFTLYPGLLFYAAAIFIFNRNLQPGEGVNDTLDRKPLTPFLEVAAFLVLFGLAVFLRTYRIQDVPPGIAMDAAKIGLGGLAVLEGWRPFFENDMVRVASPLLYLAAAWFKVFSPTPVNLALFFTAFSLAALPFIYWAFRQLAGPRPALLALFLYVVARWSFFSSRWGNVNLPPIFFAFGALALWLQGLSKGKTRYYLGAGLFLGAGFYAHYTFWLFPVAMAAFTVFEAKTHPELFRRDKFRWLAMFAVAGLAAVPLFWHLAWKPHFGEDYLSDLFIGREMWREKTFLPLLKNGLRFLLMFNREGDPQPYSNSGSCRMLDDITGVFFVLGAGFCLSHLRQRIFFYALVPAFFFCMNIIPTGTPTNSGRILPLVPLAAFLASFSLWLVYRKAAEGGLPKKWAGIGLGLLLVLAGLQNFNQLFFVQARDPACWTAFDVGPTRAGEEIAQGAADYDYVLCTSLGLHYTVQFLAHGHPKDYKVWDWPGDLALPRISPGKKGVVFLMEEGEEGIFVYLKSLYPRCQAEVSRDLQGFPLLYRVRISRKELLSARGSATASLNRGMEADYFRPGSGEGPVYRRWDPLVNFTNRTDLALFNPPLSIRWNGKIRIGKEGQYDFLALTEPTDRAQVTLDGKAVTPLGPVPSGSVTLHKGWHAIRLDFQMGDGYASAISLAWKKPGDEKYEIIPPQAFGPAASTVGVEKSGTILPNLNETGSPRPRE